MIYIRKGNVTSEIRLTGVSGAGTVIAGGMLTSFARHEPAAVQAARQAYRLGRRTRLERWAWVPVPKGYAGPKRRARPASWTDGRNTAERGRGVDRSFVNCATLDDGEDE